MKLRIGTLVAATMLALTACGASEISFDEYKAKAAALEDHEYKSALVSGSIKVNGEKAYTADKVAFSYAGGEWTTNDAAAYAAGIGELVGQNVKDAASAGNPGEGYHFFSDLSIEFSLSMMGANYEGKMKADDKYGFVTYYLEKVSAVVSGTSYEQVAEFTFTYSD